MYISFLHSTFTVVYIQLAAQSTLPDHSILPGKPISVDSPQADAAVLLILPKSNLLNFTTPKPLFTFSDRTLTSNIAFPGSFAGGPTAVILIDNASCLASVGNLRGLQQFTPWLAHHRTAIPTSSTATQLSDFLSLPKLGNRFFTQTEKFGFSNSTEMKQLSDTKVVHTNPIKNMTRAFWSFDTNSRKSSWQKRHRFYKGCVNFWAFNSFRTNVTENIWHLLTSFGFLFLQHLGSFL